MIRARTPHAQLVWLSPMDIAGDLGVSRPTASKIIRKIPGAELMYRFEGRKGERWRVRREDYNAWKQEQNRPSATAPNKPIVYFIQFRGQPDAPVKIGRTTTRMLATRLSCLQVCNPYPLAVIATLPGDERVEQALHQRFNDSRLSGEWFEMTPGLREFLSDVNGSI